MRRAVATGHDHWHQSANSNESHGVVPGALNRFALKLGEVPSGLSPVNITTIVSVHTSPRESDTGMLKLYCTINVRGIVWVLEPEVAVTVSV
jgi:hypothetical protein